MQKRENKPSFGRIVCSIALPVALQSMLQSSFGIVDQVMIGQLGSTSIAAVGLAAKFASIFSVVVAAVGTVAGIMIAQYIGAGDEKAVSGGLSVNLLAAVGIGAFFMLLCLAAPEQVIRLYTADVQTVREAAVYLRVVSWSFLPMALSTMFAAWLRCRERADIPLYATIAAVLCNTGLNYCLIFGKCGAPAMGSLGAGIATAASQWGNLAFMLAGFLLVNRKLHTRIGWTLKGMDMRQYAGMLLPIVVNEFLWSVGENIYAMIYGHLGTESLAAMTLTNPIQGLLIGALSGMSGAASVLIGKQLGQKDYKGAYRDAKKLMLAGFAGSLCLSFLLLAGKETYTSLFRVEASVRQLAEQILTVFAWISPVKVLNMILGGGILRSGGDTRTVLMIDLMGTWLLGVPLGLLAAYVLRLEIPYVYLLLSLEELARLAVSVWVFQRKKWMRTLF